MCFTFTCLMYNQESWLYIMWHVNVLLDCTSNMWMWDLFFWPYKYSLWVLPQKWIKLNRFDCMYVIRLGQPPFVFHCQNSNLDWNTWTCSLFVYFLHIILQLKTWVAWLDSIRPIIFLSKQIQIFIKSIKSLTYCCACFQTKNVRTNTVVITRRHGTINFYSMKRNYIDKCMRIWYNQIVWPWIDKTPCRKSQVDNMSLIPP